MSTRTLVPTHGTQYRARRHTRCSAAHPLVSLTTADIEVLQGPNNQKQHLNLRCGGSTQPFHAVIDTPGPGWMIRCNSKKYLEDGLFEIACAPYGKPNENNPADSVVAGYGGF